MNKLLQILNNIVTSGIQGGYESEPVRKVVTINLFTPIGVIFMIIFGIKTLNFNLLYSIVVFINASIVILVFFYLRFTKNYIIASYLLNLLMIALLLFFLISGGENNTAILWYYVFPILSVFTLGNKKGSIFIVILLLITAILLFFEPDFMAKYNVNLKIRFIATFIAVSLMAITFEFVRKKTYQALEETNNKKSFYLNKVIVQKKEIVTQSEKLQLANKELEEHRNHLEQLVKERTEELEIAKDKAEESDRLKSAFLANMSHEIRTPMNAIMGFSNLLIDPEINDDFKKEMVLHITHNTNTLLKLIEDIIDISKIESGQLVTNIRKIDIHKILDDVYDEFKERNELSLKKSINFYLDNDIRHENLYLNSDSSHIKQILTNLIDNAFKFTDEGSIHFGYFIYKKIKNPYVKFYVRDTGIGLTGEDQTCIFNRFTKSEITKQKLFRGAGLGLSICKSLAEIMGGRIWVESELNQGSIFYFTIPFDDSEV